MSELYVKQIKYIQKRWPEVYKAIAMIDRPEYRVIPFSGKQVTLKLNDIHLTSCYDRQQEAEIICQQLLLSQTDVVTLYGAALGDAQRILLSHTWLKHLRVVILNPEVLFYEISFENQLDWMVDPRVELIVPENTDDVQFPYAAYPSELELASDSLAMLRDNVALETSNDFIAAQHQANNPKIVERLQANLPFIESDSGVQSLFTNQLSEVAWVLGAGPTLEKQLPHIMAAKNRGDLIIAVDAAVLPILKFGITPDFVVTIDENASILFTESCWRTLGSSKLVYFPRVSRDVLEQWRGPRYCAFSNSNIYRALAEKYTKGFLFSSGSVIHPAIDLAVKLGAKTVVLAGADFSFPNNQTHTHWKQGAHFMPDKKSVDWVLNGLGGKVRTVANLKGYLRDLERYIRYHPDTVFYNTSLDGAYISGTRMWEDCDDL